MSILVENYEPEIQQAGFNSKKNFTLSGTANFDMSGSTGTFKFPTGVVGFNSGTATGAALAATLSTQVGVITTEAFTTAAATDIGTYTITNTLVAATSRIFVSIGNGTNTTGEPVVAAVTPGAGSFTVQLRNVSTAGVMNGTTKLSFLVL